MRLRGRDLEGCERPPRDPHLIGFSDGGEVALADEDVATRFGAIGGGVGCCWTARCSTGMIKAFYQLIDDPIPRCATSPSTSK